MLHLAQRQLVQYILLHIETTWSEEEECLLNMNTHTHTHRGRQWKIKQKAGAGCGCLKSLFPASALPRFITIKTANKTNAKEHNSIPTSRHPHPDHATSRPSSQSASRAVSQASVWTVSSFWAKGEKGMCEHFSCRNLESVLLLSPVSP